VTLVVIVVVSSINYELVIVLSTMMFVKVELVIIVMNKKTQASTPNTIANTP
jgi:hypothetical protein